jgi:hypothetical protein
MDQKSLDFAYKYPFSDEAKALIAGMGESKIEYKYLEAGKKHIDDALNGRLQYRATGMTSAKTDYLITYLYSRMLLSATRSRQLINQYCTAEAARSSEALSGSDIKEIEAVVKELGIPMNVQPFSKALALSIRFDAFLELSQDAKGFELSNQKLGNGFISLEMGRAIALIEKAICSKMGKGMPISAEQLPKEVTEYAKGIRPAAGTAQKVQRTGTSNWVEKLLVTPIPDVRHRTVNLILAPYLVNSRGMSVEQATKTITEYIERCKALNPSTRITERYIEYQCAYAKKRGLRPLSFDRAKDLLGDVLDLETVK